MTASVSPLARFDVAADVATLQRDGITRDYYDALPAPLKQHLVCRIVDELIPVTQKHGIEGLVMGAD